MLFPKTTKLNYLWIAQLCAPYRGADDATIWASARGLSAICCGGRCPSKLFSVTRRLFHATHSPQFKLYTMPSNCQAGLDSCQTIFLTSRKWSLVHLIQINHHIHPITLQTRSDVKLNFSAHSSIVTPWRIISGSICSRKSSFLVMPHLWRLLFIR